MNQFSILVVDDEPINFDVIDALLNNKGYSLQYASSGQEALDSLKMEKLDLILLDVMMPEMDGVEVCSRIRANPEWHSIPIIMVTILTGKEELARCLNAGADDFISKPVNGMELSARVHSMLRIKKNYDDVQSLLKLQEDMVNMLVHDLRNPLSNIMLAVDLLSNPNLSQRQTQNICFIKSSAEKLRILIDDVLLMARLKSGNIHLNIFETDINTVISSVLTAFEAIAWEKKIKIINQLPKLSGIIKIDEVMFVRVLDNLLSNGIKFSSKESQIIVSGEYPPSGGAIIRITDFGRGVPDHFKQSIFEKYEIGASVQNVPQIGLGLAFCKMIIEAHGGSIRVEDNQPSGAIFEIILP